MLLLTAKLSEILTELLKPVPLLLSLVITSPPITYVLTMSPLEETVKALLAVSFTYIPPASP